MPCTPLTTLFPLLLTGVFSGNLYGASISHTLRAADQGRLVLELGESAQGILKRAPEGFTFEVQPDTVVSLNSTVHGAGAVPGCTVSVAALKIKVHCAGRKVSIVSDVLLPNPRRVVLDYAVEGTLRVASDKRVRSPARSRKKSKPSVFVTLPKPELSLKGVSENEMTTSTASPEETSPEEQDVQARDLTPVELFHARNRMHIQFDVLRQEVNLEYTLPAFPVVEREDKIINLYHLALKLFQDKQYALALKTVKMVRNSAPSHPIWEHLAFLEAETYVHLANELNGPKYFQEAIARYKTAVGKYPDAIYVEPALTHVGQMQLQRKEYYGALSTFISALDKKKKSPFRYQWRLGMAESLLGQNRFDEARQMYHDLAAQKEDAPRRLEAVYRLGDTSSARRQYGEAITLYTEAIAQEGGDPTLAGALPPTLKGFPSVLFNLAEAYFWSEDYRRSYLAYKKFVATFPLHPNAALAYARVGELMAIFRTSWGRIQGAYLEANFRHPESLGADISQIRLATEDLIVGSEHEVKNAQMNLEILFEKYKKDTQMLDLLILLRAEVMSRTRRYLEAFRFLEGEYLLRPSRPYARYFRRNIYKNLSLAFRELRRNNECSVLLATYSEKRHLWFSEENPYFDRHLEVALCALKRNLNDVASEHLQKYEETLTAAKAKPTEWPFLQNIQIIAANYEIEFYRSLAALESEQFSAAAKGFQAVVADNDTPPYLVDCARMYLVLASLRGGEYQQAFEVLASIRDRSVLQNHPYEVLKELSKAKPYAFEGQAVKLVEQVLHTFTTPAEQLPLWMAKAELLWNMGQFGPAAQVYEGVIRLPAAQLKFETATGPVALEPLGDLVEQSTERVQNLEATLRSRVLLTDEVEQLQSLAAYRAGLARLRLREPGKSKEYFELARSLAPQSTWALAAAAELNTLAFQEKYNESIRTRIGRQPAEQGGLQ